jgi:3-isopropylmalate/(R)-2-methylmalate dehydratase large subunit
MPTLIDKIWAAHVARDLGGGWALLHIDRTLIHDLLGSLLKELSGRGLALADRSLVFATADHAVSSAPGRTAATYPLGGRLHATLKEMCATLGIRFFDIGQEGQGIVHVMGPELGIVQPGTTVICCDSHTCTNGALGALAFGIGSTEMVHALATSTLRMRKPRQMRLTIDGALSPGVTAKDLILHIIGTLGASAGVEHIVEFAGTAVQAMDIEARLTLCNLAVELGARSGIVAPDEKTIAYLNGRRYAPAAAQFADAAAHWRTLCSDPDASFDREERFDAAAVPPTVTWGTSPEDAIAIDATIPDPGASADPAQRQRIAMSLAYMGLEAGRRIAGTPIDRVFIGSCANSRISDLRDAAAIVRGRQVASRVTAWVVPGSVAVKRAAEAEGLDQVFLDAGFEWREPGCSMCVAANGEQAGPGSRVVSTSNRNFVGRQGPGARTHLASPAMAAAAALKGEITDVRNI